MSVDLQVKKGDTRDWVFTISDTDDTALDLASAIVKFNLREDEWDTDTFFVRDTNGTGSDNISISTPASDGQVTITPTTADWTEISDNYGIYVGEFRVSDANGDIIYTKDIVVHIQEALID